MNKKAYKIFLKKCEFTGIKNISKSYFKTLLLNFFSTGGDLLGNLKLSLITFISNNCL